MYAINITDGVHVHHWMKADSPAEVKQLVKQLPANGWELACVLVWSREHKCYVYSAVVDLD